MFTKKLSKTRKALSDESKRIKEVSDMLRVHRQEIKAVYETFPRSVRKYIHLACDHWDRTIRLSLSMQDLEGFKDPNLIKVLAAFADWDGESKDYTGDQPNRDFYFERRSHTGLSFRVSIYAYVRSDSPTCKIVVTGVNRRVVEEEVREIVCA
jgi:hypothetical protein